MLSILFPRTCHICGDVLRQGVWHVCEFCMQELPYAHQFGVVMNGTEQRFASVPEVECAAGWIYYRPKTEAALLLERIKYGGYSRLAEWLGERMGEAAMSVGMQEGVDAIVPVPLHFMRRMRRGYNQSEQLAHGVGRIWGIPVVNLAGASCHRTQTSLSARERRRNVQGVYRVRQRELKKLRSNGLQLLLVDDVCTTGATLTALAETIAAAVPGVKLRILTLATTDR